MIPSDWIAHRRADGELVGYLVEEPAPGSESYRPVNVFGHPLDGPSDIVSAMELLEEVGMSGLAAHWWLCTDGGERVRVKIYEATPEHVIVIGDDFGTGADLGVRTTLPVPVGDRPSPG